MITLLCKKYISASDKQSWPVQYIPRLVVTIRDFFFFFSFDNDQFKWLSDDI